jgi:hypothetical protein
MFRGDDEVALQMLQSHRDATQYHPTDSWAAVSLDFDQALSVSKETAAAAADLMT